jgi:hypothetical protein
MGRPDASELWRSRESESARSREKLPYGGDQQMMQWLKVKIFLLFWWI